jgi:hypothetical protein
MFVSIAALEPHLADAYKKPGIAPRADSANVVPARVGAYPH